MSTQPTSAVARLFPLPAEPVRRPEPSRPSSRARVATVQRNLHAATDALAAAYLLLGINWSVSAVGADPQEEP